MQKTHDFKFGANIFMLEEFEKEDKNKKYKEFFKEIFNIATLPLYWSDIEPEMGQVRYDKDSPKIYRRPATDLCVEYCLENGIEPKVHCLAYENFIPTWLVGAEPNKAKYYLEKRMKELSERYSDVIPSWEVTNETLDPFVDHDNGKCSDFFYENDFVEWCWRTAEKYFPHNRLIINDYKVFDLLDTCKFYMGNRSQYYMQIEKLLSSGIHHMDSIGMQFHSFIRREAEAEQAKYRYNPSALFRIMDKYEELGKKMQITEMTIPAYSYEEEDEELQAEILKNIYSIFFSQKEMEAIIYWNVVDGYAAFAPQGDMTSGENYYHGGLLRFDMTKKPAFYALDELINKTWHTEVDVVTNGEGKASFKGFYGKYDVEIVIDGKTIKKEIHLAKNLKEHKIVI